MGVVMRVVVYGGRDWDNQAALDTALDFLHAQHGFTRLIHGGYRGADRQAEYWADRRGVPVHCFSANWGRYGARAGPLRNQWMVDVGRPELAVEFPGGRGTRDMRRRLEKAGVPVVLASLAVPDV